MTERRLCLKPYRLKLGVSQRELGERLGVPQCTYSTWERGRFDPPTWVLPVLAKEFGVSIEQLYEADTSIADREERDHGE